MATRRKKTKQTNDFLKERLAQINKVIEKLEGEVEKAVNRFMRRGEKSSKVIKKNFDEVLERISNSDLYYKATEKTEELTKEVRRLADDVIDKLKGFDIKVANTLLKDIRGNVDEIVEKIQDTGLVEFAKDKAVTTRKQVLNVLNIPSQEEVSKISRKVVSIEKKLKTLSRRRAA